MAEKVEKAKVKKKAKVKGTKKQQAYVRNLTKKRIPSEKVYSKKKEFLEELKNNGGLVTTAARTIGVGRQSVYDWKNQDKVFSELWDEIIQEEDDLFVEGTERTLKNVINREEGFKIHPSLSVLLIFTLKTKGRSRGWEEKASGSGMDLSGDIIKEEIPQRELPKKDKEECVEDQIITTT